MIIILSTNDRNAISVRIFVCLYSQRSALNEITSHASTGCYQQRRYEVRSSYLALVNESARLFHVRGQ